MKVVYGIPGRVDQYVSSTGIHPGDEWIVMEGERPEPNMIAQADGTWISTPVEEEEPSRVDLLEQEIETLKNQLAQLLAQQGD